MRFWKFGNDSISFESLQALLKRRKDAQERKLKETATKLERARFLVKGASKPEHEPIIQPIMQQTIPRTTEEALSFLELQLPRTENEHINAAFEEYELLSKEIMHLLPEIKKNEKLLELMNKAERAKETTEEERKKASLVHEAAQLLKQESREKEEMLKKLRTHHSYKLDLDRLKELRAQQDKLMKKVSAILQPLHPQFQQYALQAPQHKDILDEYAKHPAKAFATDIHLQIIPILEGIRQSMGQEVEVQALRKLHQENAHLSKEVVEKERQIIHSSIFDAIERTKDDLKDLRIELGEPKTLNPYEKVRNQINEHLKEQKLTLEP